jgi:hypothetical protein
MYSSDFTPCDTYLFSQMKGYQFMDAMEIQATQDGLQKDSELL